MMLRFSIDAVSLTFLSIYPMLLHVLYEPGVIERVMFGVSPLARLGLGFSSWKGAIMLDDELLKIVDSATERYKGDCTVLETAIGALVVGRVIGWKPLFLIHANPTIKRYEQVLQISFRDVLPDVGRRADKSLAWHVVQSGKKFWDVFRASVPGRSLSLE